MSYDYDDLEIPKQVEAGRLLSERLRIARETAGSIACPNCHANFDATHVMKCPECRTFIDESFQVVVLPGQKGRAQPRGRKPHKKSPARRARVSRKVKEKGERELDFFTQGYMEYKG